MFLVTLRFSKNKDQAGQWMDSHNCWIQRGFDDRVFLLTGSIEPKMGGAIVAHALSQLELQARVNADPFVANDVVSAEILEITPARVDPRLDFLRQSK